MAFLVNLVFRRLDKFDGPTFGGRMYGGLVFGMLLGLHICGAYMRGEGVLMGFYGFYGMLFVIRPIRVKMFVVKEANKL